MSPIPLLTAAAYGLLAGLLIAALPLWRLSRALGTARRQANFDDTTALPNRRAFLAAVHDAQSADRPFGIIMLDLNRFKTVNDGLGHEAGNDLLAALGQRLAALPSPIRLAARLSGDEFALLVDGDPHDTFHAARLAATTVRSEPVTLHGPFIGTTAEPVPRPGPVIVTVGASVGYTVGRLGVTARELLQEADEAMFGAKQAADGIRRYEPAEASAQPRPGRCRDRR
ncbi:diguanylate cyclase domain-containing protein [Dactylosporangium cerinum]|uniref:Diguanylate cyclase domain-containing protein n=1 Tax=Dactylosporangium cerinum TaxID=1434730 RepID=A0ABV9WHY4_9ACTN